MDDKTSTKQAYPNKDYIICVSMLMIVLCPSSYGNTDETLLGVILLGNPVCQSGISKNVNIYTVPFIAFVRVRCTTQHANEPHSQSFVDRRGAVNAAPMTLRSRNNKRFICSVSCARRWRNEVLHSCLCTSICRSRFDLST